MQERHVRGRMHRLRAANWERLTVPVPAAPRANSGGEEPEEFVIRADRGFGPYWRENRQGYTGNVNDAGRYTRNEAEEIERLRGTDIKQPAPPITVPVPREVLREVCEAMEEGAETLRYFRSYYVSDNRLGGQPLTPELKRNDAAFAALRSVLAELRGYVGGK
jgi:hypothetical protein